MREARAVFPGVKKGNDYAAALGDAYNAMPKAVTAGIMVSLAMRLSDDDLNAALALIREEWATLHRSGIIPQEPK